MLRIVAPAKLIQRVQPSLEVPSGVSDMVVRGFKLANDGHDCINRHCRPLGQDFNLSNVKLGGSNEIVEKTI
jgi:hypothetical protein